MRNILMKVFMMYKIFKIFFICAIILPVYSAFACGEDESFDEHAVVPWIEQSGGEACYYRKYNPAEMEENQQLTEGYIWLKTVFDPYQKREKTFIELTFNHEDFPIKWAMLHGYLTLGESLNSYHIGWFDGCDTMEDIAIRAKNDGISSIYLERYWGHYYVEGNMDALSVESKLTPLQVLRFDRVDNNRCYQIEGLTDNK